VTFADETAEDTTATFSAAGDYVLQLTADDGELTGDDTVAITVEDAPPPPPGNTAPEVTASGPATVTLPDAAVLDGTVTDDGPYTVLWSRVSGPGTVAFADETAEDTSATFSAAGDYVLRLTADDGELTGDDTVAITVEEEVAPPPPPDPQATTEVFEGSLNKKWTARTFETTVADGPADAVMTFGGRGKKAASVQLTVNVYDAAGELVATATGTSPIELTATLGAGTYTWEVTGDRASFSLAVTYLTP
jgi:PKD repeat protein